LLITNLSDFLITLQYDGMKFNALDFLWFHILPHIDAVLCTSGG